MVSFLANENFPLEAVEALRAIGHDVAWVRMDAPGIADPEVLKWAVRERRVLLTFDKDFGELAFRSRLPAESGIILFRLPFTSAAALSAAVMAAVAEGHHWAGHFSIVEAGRIRMRALPAIDP